MESPKRYHPALVTLHWLIALLVFVNLFFGIVLFEGRRISLQALEPFIAVHMASGITIMILLVTRFIVRMKTSKPAEATAGNKLLDKLARLVHYALYVTVLAVTIIGLVFSLQTGNFQSAFLGAKSRFGPPPGGFPSGQGTPRAQVTPPTDGNGAVPGGGGAPAFPGGPNSRRGPGGPGGIFSLLMIHLVAANFLFFLVSLHILAALYHQFIRKDSLISRMWYGERH
jgi:cytochrome b561